MRFSRDFAAYLLHRAGRLVDCYAPQLCVFCDQPSHRAEPICDTCSAALLRNHGACPGCALPDCAGALCPACQHSALPLRIVAPFVYERTMAYLLHRWKYGRERPLVTALALLATTEPPRHALRRESPSEAAPLDDDLQLHPDWDACASLCATALACGDDTLALPTPLHWRRRLYRGFNQSADLLYATRQRCPALTGAVRGARGVRLLRCRGTAPQAMATRDDRLRNLRGAFVVHGAIPDRPVLLVDDVCTTGATGVAMAAALREAGASSVTLWCLARTPRH